MIYRTSFNGLSVEVLGVYKVYNVTNEDYCSWADFAKYIFESNNLNTKVNEVSTEEYLKITGIKQAYRPRNSRLSKEKLENNGFDRLPTWKDATDRYCDELIKQDDEISQILIKHRKERN